MYLVAQVHYNGSYFVLLSDIVIHGVFEQGCAVWKLPLPLVSDVGAARHRSWPLLGWWQGWLSVRIHRDPQYSIFPTLVPDWAGLQPQEGKQVRKPVTDPGEQRTRLEHASQDGI